MAVQVRAKQNVKYQGKVIAVGTVLSLTQEQLAEMPELFVTLEEEERLEKEKAEAPKPFDPAEYHARMKSKFMEDERLRAEAEATLLEKQLEDQAKLVKSSAARLRSKSKG